jgi:phage baseplate assembly protein W
MAIRPTKAIDLPFRFSVDGGVATTTDPDRRIRQRLISIVGTEPTERVMLPQFGVPVASFLFEPDPDSAAVELRSMTEIQAAMWEPALQVRSVIPIVNGEGNVTEIEMRYRRLSGPDNDFPSPKVHTAEITDDGQILEWLRG